jgi:hypothetical protein
MMWFSNSMHEFKIKNFDHNSFDLVSNNDVQVITTRSGDMFQAEIQVL